MIHRSNDPIARLTVKAIFAYDALSPAGKAAYDARVAARSVKVEERQALERQLQDVERQLRNVNPLPAAHPARALEAGLLEQAAALRLAIDAVVIPPHPNAHEVAAAIEEMWRR